MASDPELSALLPSPPPPRPDRREHAITAAMAQFDGAAPPEPAARPARRRRFAGRPELGALAAAALIAAIGLPLWLSNDYRPEVATKRPAAITPARPAPPTAAADVAAEPPAPPRASPAEPVPTRAPPATPSTSLDLKRVAEQATTAPPPAALAPPAPVISLAAPPPPPPPPPPPVVSHAAVSRREALGEMVVTGSRVSSPVADAQQVSGRDRATRDDWTACTLDDPRRDIAVCRDRPTAVVARDAQAEALVEDGLTFAWQGDLAKAIAAFDRALARSPRFAPAWLNRGLAYARAGDDARARADLDKAVHYAPTDPRVWHQRSLVLRRLGQVGRAEADAARALKLDPP